MSSPPVPVGFVFRTPQVFPAIDVRDGRCVRLIRGARDAEIHYDDDPMAVAQRWKDAGARCLHVIDLGAAFSEAHSRRAILAITAATGLPVQAGGGLREEESITELLDGGVARVILGTRALGDPAFLARVVERWGARRIVVSLDCDGERVKVAGWEKDSALGIEAALGAVAAAGVERLLVTATDRDGTLGGPRLELFQRVLAATEGRVVAAGGIGSLADVRDVLSLQHPRLEGVVVGRALYEGAVRLDEAVALTVPDGVAPNLEPPNARR